MRLPFLSLSGIAPPHLRPLSFWMHLTLCSLLLDRRTSSCLQDYLPAPPHLLLVPLAPLPVLLALVSQMRPLRPLHPRHGRPRPLRPPPSATSRPDSTTTGAACHLVLRRRSMSSRRSSRADLALQRRQLLHLRRHRCLRMPSPCPPSSTSTPWRLGQSAVFVFPPSSPPLPCLQFRRCTTGALQILPGAPPCWKSMMLYCRITLGTWCHVPPCQCCH
jgi:hypothetical protein